MLASTLTKKILSWLVLLTAAASTPIIFSRSQIPWPYIDVMAYPYFAKCDGVTDDSTALQQAINASPVLHETVILPPGRTCSYSTTLRSSAAFSMSVAGAPSAASSGGAFSATQTILKYTGSGDGIVIQNGSNIIYNVNLSGFVLENVQVAGRGIACINCFQYYPDGILVQGNQNFTVPVFGWAVAFDMTGDSGVTANAISWSDVGVGVKLSNFADGNFSQNVAYANGTNFLIGNSTQVWIHDGAFEAMNYFAAADDTQIAGLKIDEGFYVYNNNILLDQAGASSIVYTPQNVLYVNNIVGTELYASNWVFSNNNLSCPSVTCTATYAFNLSMAGSGSLLTLEIDRNWADTFSTSLVSSNSNSISVNTVLNQNLKADGATPNLDFTGTGIFNGWVFTSGNLTATSAMSEIFANSTPATLTITLPVNLLGHRVHVVNTGTNTVNLVCSSGNMSGASQQTLGGGHGVAIVADGTNCWWEAPD